MITLLAVALLLQVLLPLALLLSLWRGQPASRAAWLLHAVGAACYFAIIALAVPWLVVPWYALYAYVALFVAALAASWRGVRGQPWWPRRGWLRLGFTAAMTALSVAAVAYVASGRQPPPGAPVDLAFPLRGGPYYAVNAGSNRLLNPHVAALTDEGMRLTGQGYAVDLVKLDRFGLRADGVLPDELERYAIFNEPVHAPCAGTVLAARGDMPDLIPPRTDRDNPAGNHVLLRCGDAVVLLAHLQRGSVAVVAGQGVATGDPLGRVGNSGNTTEPHLHVHAQRPGPAHEPLAGEPLPMLLDGDFLVRNERVTR